VASRLVAAVGLSVAVGEGESVPPCVAVAVTQPDRVAALLEEEEGEGVREGLGLGLPLVLTDLRGFEGDAVADAVPGAPGCSELEAREEAVALGEEAGERVELKPVAEGVLDPPPPPPPPLLPLGAVVAVTE